MCIYHLKEGIKMEETQQTSSSVEPSTEKIACIFGKTIREECEVRTELAFISKFQIGRLPNKDMPPQLQPMIQIFTDLLSTMQGDLSKFCAVCPYVKKFAS